MLLQCHICKRYGTVLFFITYLSITSFSPVTTYMKNLIYILLLSVTFTGNLWAQRENNNWAYASGRGITFNTSSPSQFLTAVHPDVLAHVFWPSAVSDAAGNLLFYISGNALWDRHHQMIQNGDDVFLTPNYDNVTAEPYSKHAHSTLIIPEPGSATRYYVIANGVGSYLDKTANRASSYIHLRYSIVDMSLNNGKGAVVPGAKNILLSTDSVDLPIIAAGNGTCKKWVLCKKRFSNQVLAYEITSTGINTNPVVSMISPHLLHEIDISHDNKKLAIKSVTATYKDYDPSTDPMFLHIYDFDVNTGIVSNGILIDTINNTGARSIRGMAFSGDHSKFYYHENPNPGNTIYQYDLTKSSVAGIINSKTKVFSYYQGALPWDMTLGPDGKIYINNDSGRFIVINNPDKTGTACNVSTIQLTGPWRNGMNGTGLHNWVPVSKVISSHADFNTCTLPVQLKSYKDNADSYIWNTGATTQSITAHQNGTYWVKAADACGAYRIDSFHINFNPPQPFPDTFSCNGQPITMPIDPQAYYEWHDNDGAVITRSGIYAVKITKDQCGSIEDTFEAIIYPPVNTRILDKDTVICHEGMYFEARSLYSLNNYIWSTGATTRAIPVQTPGTFWLTANTPCGLFTDTIRVSFCVPEIEEIISADTVCSGNCVRFSARVKNYPQQYDWQFEGGWPGSSTAAEAEICYTQTGDYSIRLTASGPGGNDTRNKRIKVLPQPDTRFTDTAVTVPYKTLLILPTCDETASEINWYKDGQAICPGCQQLQVDAKELAATYICVVRNATCTDTCIYTVDVTGIPNDVWLPTGFTPNKDGKNDIFRVVTDNPNIEVIDFSVYNRFGQRVFSGQGIDGWDGKVNGIFADIGTYFWSVSYRVRGRSESFSLRGDVVLIR